LAFFGSFGKRAARFNYQAMVVSGLNANGFDRNNWVKKGKQGKFEEDRLQHPAFVARLDWTGLPGLRAGVSYYHCGDAGAMPTSPRFIRKSSLSIFFLSMRSMNIPMSLRAATY